MSNNDPFDLDDILDNALNEFDNISTPSKTTTNDNNNQSTPSFFSSNITTSNNNNASSSSFIPPTNNNTSQNEEIDLDEVFNKTLTPEERQVFQQLTDQVTNFFNDLENTTSDTNTQPSSSSSSSSNSNSNNNNANNNNKSSTENYNFQEVMKKTLDMLNKNAASMGDKKNTSSSSSSDNNNQEDDDEEVDEGSFSNLLQSMMEVLLSPDILKGPMLELREKYPLWLKEKKGQVETEEYERVLKQYDVCCKICKVYESKVFPDAMDELIELMKVMQELGQPPEEIISTLSKEGEGGAEDDNQVQKLLQGLNFAGAAGKDGKGGCPMQ
ncbi:hypothetical protein ABK040_015154 [Willaertia magna]